MRIEPWQGMETEIEAAESTEALVRRAVAYGVELARGQVAEAEVEVVWADFGAPQPQKRWETVRKVGTRLWELVGKVDDGSHSL